MWKRPSSPRIIGHQSDRKVAHPGIVQYPESWVTGSHQKRTTSREGVSARCKLATQCGTSQQIRNLSSSGKEREKGDDPRKSRTPFDPVIMQKSSHARKAGALPSEGKESQHLSRIGGTLSAGRTVVSIGTVSIAVPVTTSSTRGATGICLSI